MKKSRLRNMRLRSDSFFNILNFSLVEKTQRGIEEESQGEGGGGGGE